MRPTLTTEEEGLPEGVIDLIGTLLPNNDRFMLVGFHPTDNGKTLCPVWRDRKLCMQEARSKY